MSQTVQHNSKVLVHFTLRLKDGSLAESTYNNGKPALFCLGDGSLSPAIERELEGLSVTDKRTFTLEPEEAFGQTNPDLIHYFSRQQFHQAEKPEPGTIMLFSAMDGSERPGIIREISGDSVTVDFNHPLAGESVRFDIEVLDINPVQEEKHANSVS